MNQSKIGPFVRLENFCAVVSLAMDLRGVEVCMGAFTVVMWPSINLNIIQWFFLANKTNRFSLIANDNQHFSVGSLIFFWVISKLQISIMYYDDRNNIFIILSV